MRLEIPLLAALYLSLGAGAAKLKPGQKILLSQVDTLTLRNDQMTKARRVEPMPQLKCVGGDGKGRYEVDVMRCRNQGSNYDDEDISWACTADLPREFKLGATDVICEGYDDPDDNYVLKGSCGVEYRLALTDYGYEKYGYSTFSKMNSNSRGVNLSLIVFWLFFFSVLAVIIYSSCTPSANRRTPGNPRDARRPWFWGGGGGGDPPPPYDSNPPPAPKPRYSTSGQQQGPGFWTGAAAGAAGAAAASYLAGNRSSERERAAAAAGYGYNPSQSYYTSRPQSGGGGESSTSGERHSSTGFGQTRRR